MTTLTTYPALEQTAGTIGESPATPVYAVVGFDGSPPAIRALDGAARLLHGRAGGLEVVFVAHVTPLEAMAEVPVSAAAVPGRSVLWGIYRSPGGCHCQRRKMTLALTPPKPNPFEIACSIVMRLAHGRRDRCLSRPRRYFRD